MPGKIWEHLLRQDKGTLLIEATICVGIAGVLGLSTTHATVAANQAQRTSANFNIAAQVAQGALEQAKSTPWQQLGVDHPVTGTSDPLLPPGTEVAPVGTLASSKSLPVQNQNQAHPLNITTNVSVGWAQKPIGASTYGSKIVVVKTTWYDVEGDPKTMHSSSQQVVITPGVGEAPPSGVRGTAGGASAATPSPVAPAPVPTYTPVPEPTTTAPPVAVASPTPTPTTPPPPPPVVSPIDTKAAQTPWIGTPTGVETGGLPRGGRYRDYSNGRIYWQPDIGAVAMRNGTGDTGAFNNAGGVTGTFGYPTGDEATISPGVSSYQSFENGQLYWKSNLGSIWIPYGPLRDKWLSNGGYGGWNGFPRTGYTTGLRNGGVVQSFENGTIYWTPDTGASSINGAIFNQFANMGYEAGPMGYPIGDEYSWNGQTRHDFQNGFMTWTAGGGVVNH